MHVIIYPRDAYAACGSRVFVGIVACVITVIAANIARSSRRRLEANYRDSSNLLGPSVTLRWLLRAWLTVASGAGLTVSCAVSYLVHLLLPSPARLASNSVLPVHF